ncbi:hypothetical protein LINGRAPRIM_LOCUS2306 [Linum grandiflorum]
MLHLPTGGSASLQAGKRRFRPRLSRHRPRFPCRLLGPPWMEGSLRLQLVDG